MIVLIRCNDLVSDSRAKKYLDFYKAEGIDYRLIVWDRLGTSERLPNAVYCPVRSKYNQGGLAAIVDRLKWMWFILRTLFSFHDGLHIHACDLDAAFPAAVYKMFSRRKNFVLFDVFDWISDTLDNQGRIVSLAFRFMEWVSVRKADHIIICEPERVHQIPYNIEGRYSVLQNIPSFSQRDFLVKKAEYSFSNDLLTLVYVGSFTHNRCLAELIEEAAAGNYNLNIAGYGDARILELLEKNNDSPYIHYFGKVAYQDGLCIQYNSDIIYAMYSKITPNHFYAAPNKYYEAMFVGKPIITTKGIVVAEKVEANGIGYSIEETTESLVALVSSLTPEDIALKAAKSSQLWKHYSTATEDYLHSTYSHLMNLKQQTAS
jgi:glycosyltransferase involved in cell wall biosynthesis